jgi:hypothetical protein
MSRFHSRTAYAAAHVVVDPLAGDPVSDPRIDWDATMQYRRYLWSLGFGVAEAMDTAQRGGGLPPELVHELIARSVTQARACDGAIACGVGTDGLERGATLAQIERAYCEELEFVEDLGAPAIVMASRALCAAANSADDYVRLYDRVLGSARRPVILHWLGPMFDPQLEGYWGGVDRTDALSVVLHIIGRNADKVDGIKLSLLDEGFEVRVREQLPSSVKLYTGDDFNYPTLIAGDERSHSHALLGIFDPIAPIAARAFSALDAGDAATFREILAPTVPLARKLFEAPTHAYKTGVVFLAYLNGHQSHFRMLAGAERARSVEHLTAVFALANDAGLFDDPQTAAARMREVLGARV